MFKDWFKKYFVPGEGNDLRPCFWHGDNIKKVTLALIAIELIVFVLPTLFVIKNDTFISSVLPGVLSNLTNEERIDVSLTPLKSNPQLDLAAQKKAEDMAKNSYFAHTSPTGRTPWSWLKEAGYTYIYAGENLAVNFLDSEDVTRAWMNSPSHRDNILKAGYTEVGTGVAKGMYKGKKAIFVAQFYGRPGIAFNPAAASEGTQSLVTEIISSPHNTTNVLLFVFLGLVIAAFLLNFFVKIDVQHRDLLANGLFVVVLLFGLILANNTYSRSLEISDTAVSSLEGEVN
jgi:hypothetical protein